MKQHRAGYSFTMVCMIPYMDIFIQLVQHYLIWKIRKKPIRDTLDIGG